MLLFPAGVSHMAEVESMEVEKTHFKRSRIVLVGVCILFIVGPFGIWLFNDVRVDRPLQQILTVDPRNHVLNALAHFGDWVDTDTLVFDLTTISSNATRADVFRVFLQYSEVLKNRHFVKVVLSTRGRSKFTLDGNYFQELGKRIQHAKPRLYSSNISVTH